VGDGGHARDRFTEKNPINGSKSEKLVRGPLIRGTVGEASSKRVVRKRELIAAQKLPLPAQRGDRRKFFERRRAAKEKEKNTRNGHRGGGGVGGVVLWGGREHSVLWGGRAETRKKGLISLQRPPRERSKKRRVFK